jgi:tetratricopeptide (TPR) repeat protein
MGAVFILIILFFSICTAWGQTPLAKKAFDEAGRSANAGEFARALKNYRAALSVTEDGAGEFAVKLRYNLGVCHYRTGQLKAAAKEFNTAIRLSGGQHRRAFYALGMTQSALENWPAARASFLKAIELDPTDGEAWFDLAFVYLAEHDYERAAAAFRKAIENRSVDAALGPNNLGVIMAMNFLFDDAAEEFRRALETSDSRLTVAKWNLEFCRAMSAGKKELIATAGLNFARRTRVI